MIDCEKATALVFALCRAVRVLDILQGIPDDEQKNFLFLMEGMEMRYGDKYLQQMYQKQLKCRSQRNNESERI